MARINKHPKKRKSKSRNKLRVDKSPSIYRQFPDLIWKQLKKIDRKKTFKLYRKTLKIFIVVIFIIAILLVGLDLYNNIQMKKRLDIEREKLTNELIFWKSVLTSYKDYKDAYFQIAIIEYKLGNKEEAKSYLKLGLDLDPNSEKGKNIERYINE